MQDSATKLILEADTKAEGLLAIVRMVVAGCIAAALAIALNSPDRPESEFLDNQAFFATVGMTSYFMVGLITYIIVKIGLYKPWMAWISAMFDIGLISLNVWLGIFNSGLSSVYALSFPSAMMIPLVLSFGALRYRPDIQITMTILLCAITTLIIFAYPEYQTSIDTIITQMQITHSIPPNMIRVWLVFSTGVVVTIAVWRARKMLFQVANETEQRLNLTRFLPDTIMKNSSDRAITDLRTGKQTSLAIMFIDIRGFTKKVETLPPEETSQFLTEYRSHILDIVEVNGGIVDKFIGDGALIIFGANTTPKEAAANSANAAIELNKRFNELNSNRIEHGLWSFSIGIGIHFGEVLLGAIGDDRRLEFTVIGDSVNVASRIEQLTKNETYDVIASNALIDLLETEMREAWNLIGIREIRGHTEGVKLFGYASKSS